ncbi:MAG: alpha/beta hydrolase [Deltaproteobacteria bacterium]|nr:alpha/beta hydrolase [Deltaproteobacteria bacterium]
MKAYLLKIFLSVADLIARSFIYNRNPPLTREFISDVPYGNNRKQKVDVIVPYGEPPYPILNYVHGGGWLMGTKSNYTRICKNFANKGYLVFNLNYRLGPTYRYPIQLQDVATAIYWVFSNAKRYNGDTCKIFLSGDSAGAHLVSWYAAALQKKSSSR